jgi:hypothetical protein
MSERPSREVRQGGDSAFRTDRSIPRDGGKSARYVPLTCPNVVNRMTSAFRQTWHRRKHPAFRVALFTVLASRTS